MSLDLALRWTEILLALATLQAAAEHLIQPRERLLAALRIAAALVLLSGLASLPALLALSALSLWQLWMFQGPYNGGADRMGTLVLWCCALAQAPGMAELALGYLALQLTLSYFVSGWAKLRNLEWRSGQALRDVFAFSAYPVSENLRSLSQHPHLLRGAAWAVIGFEVAFPIALVAQPVLLAALALGACFHLANTVLFGLNRFVWAWLAAYPALIWLQDRLL